MNKESLCYIEGNFAYFTTQPLDKQWGDDWNDAPYEHNAGAPYEPSENVPSHWNEDETPKWEITKVAWDGCCFYPPCDGHCNSPWSVEQINSGKVPWLTSKYIKSEVDIPAGVTIEEFKNLIELGNGNVYIKSN